MCWSCSVTFARVKHHWSPCSHWLGVGSEPTSVLGLWNHVDGDRSHEIKRGLPLGRKAMTNLDTQTVLKSKGITLPTKVHTVKAMVVPGVMYRCESWTIKRAECIRIDAFELWCWRRLLRVPWTARSNQSTLKEINSIHWKDSCWRSNTLATPWEEPTHWKRPWCWERLKDRGEGDDRG